MVEFIEMFLSGGDLTNDQELKSIAQKAKDILSGVDAAEVRKQEGLRSSLQTAVNAIQAEAAKLVVVGHRKFALGVRTEPVNVEEEMKKQPEDRDPATLGAVINEALAHGLEASPGLSPD